MIAILLGALKGFGAIFAGFFGWDIFKSRPKMGKKGVGSFAVGFITDFFDTLGIGSFAPTTAFLKVFRMIEDRVLPGTLNVSHTLPVIMEAFIFIKEIKMESVTLVSMIAAAALGSYLGAGIVSKLNEKVIQRFMAVALLITAFLMYAKLKEWMPGGGDAIGLTGIKLVIGVVGNFILGALMTAGIGLYAPCMALVAMLGMSVKLAFPIMMGSCAFLMPVASTKFIREGAYDRVASLGITIGGLVGVYFATKLVIELPLEHLTKIVIGVITLTSASLFYSGFFKKDAVEE